MEKTLSYFKDIFYFFLKASFAGGFFLFPHWGQAEEKNTFRLHLGQAPQSLNPQVQKTSASSYLLTNLHRNLLRINSDGELVPDLAEKCEIKKNEIHCQLKSDLKWSDGSPLVARDFLNSYAQFLNPKTGVTRLDLIEEIDGALDFYNQKTQNFGLKQKGDRVLIFKIKNSPETFLYHLANTLLAPVDPKLEKFSGPYYPALPLTRTKIQLKSNSHYWHKNSQRPPVEVLIIEEDSVAMNLYLKGELSFLRRLPTALLTRYNSSPEFHWIELLRSDYIGFNQLKWQDLELRKKLIGGLNYPQLQALFQSEGMPGCLGFPADWFVDQKIPCYSFKKDQEKLKHTAHQKVQTLFYSAAGGDDHKRAMEWLQDQWKKNLNYSIQIKSLENKIFSADLRAGKVGLFRRGVPVEIPHCGQALEYFSSSHPENFIGFKSKEFDQLIEGFAKKSKLQQQRDCSAAAQILMDQYLMIPLGQIHFAILADPKFKGWTINSLNQLDLSSLTSH